MEEEYKNELQSILEWLEASKSEMSGETRTNVIFQIEHLKKIIRKE